MLSAINPSVSDIMHRYVVTAELATSAKDCAIRISHEHVGCLIITDNNKPVGIITERSFVDLIKKGDFDSDTICAADFMSAPLITIDPDCDFSVAMQIFNQKEIKRLPVVSGNRIIGLLTLRNMIEFSNIALTSLYEEHQRLRTESAIDPLTGLLNKAAVTDAIKAEHSRISRYGGRSSILFIDIDHFKNVNDTYSHLAGDLVLKELGALLKAACRQIDVIGRFGGEEFVIIAPNRTKYHAVRFGERIRKEIEEHDFSYQNKKIQLTVSMGIASLFEGRDYTVALERADKALYYAKHMGRNRTGLWRDGKVAIATDVTCEDFADGSVVT